MTYRKLTADDLDTFIRMRIVQLREEGAKEDLDLAPALKDYYIRQFTAEFTNLRLDIEEMFEENVIKATDPNAIGGRHINPESLKKEMVDLLGRIDEGMGKFARANDPSKNLSAWRAKVLEMLTEIAKGKGAKN